jgi:hypothetical protein
MADAGKKEFVAELNADPRTEMSSDAKKFVKGDKDLTKLIKNFTFQEKVELDPRKWSKNSLNSGVLAVARYEIKIFAVRIGELAKAGTVDKGVLSEVKTLHAKTQKYIEKKLSLAVEELANDKVDNSKALKNGKAAMEKVDGLQLKNVFSKPRNDIVALMAAISNAKDKGVDAAIKKAADAVGKLVSEFNASGREAESAVSFLLKLIKDNKSSDTQELKDFAKEAEKKRSVFQSFVSDSKEFNDALDDLGSLLKGGKMTPDDATAQSAKFKKMTGIDKSASDALKAAQGLKKSFDAIVKILK